MTETTGATATTTTTKTNSLAFLLPPRRMWDWGPRRPGYCGETCLQMALQSLGVVTGVEVVHRAIDCEELLLGADNDVRAANVLGLEFEVFDGSDRLNPKKSANGKKGTKPTQEEQAATAAKVQQEFLDHFIASHIGKGHLIACGFYGMLDHGKGDNDYDHIMPIVEHTASSSNTSSIGYYDLFVSDIRRLHAHDASVALKSRSECWRNKGDKSVKAAGALTNPIPWFFPRDHVYAMAFTGLKGIISNNNNNNSSTETSTTTNHHKCLLPLAAHVPYFMEVDSRRMYPWNIDCADNENTCDGECSPSQAKLRIGCDHPFETQLRKIKGYEKHCVEYAAWFKINNSDGLFAKVIDPKIDFGDNAETNINPMCIIPVSLRVNPFFFSPANLHQGSTFVILKFQGVLAQRIFADILGQQPSGHSDDGICNVCVVQDSVAIIDGNIGDFLAKTSVLCTEVAYFVGVEKKFYESVLLTDRRFQQMMNNFEKLQEEEKKVGPVAMMRKYAGYTGVEISIGDDEEEDEEEEDGNDDE